MSLRCSPCLFAAITFVCAGLDVRIAAQTAPAISTPAKPAPAYASDPRFQAAMAEGTQLFHRKQFGFAADNFKKANKIAGGQCYDCLHALYGAQLEDRNFRNAAATAEAMEAIAPDPVSKSVCEFRRATALYDAAGDKPKPDKLQQVHAVLKQALTNYPRNGAALFLDGKVQAALGDIQGAKAEFTECLKCVGANDPSRLRAQHFAEDPELSLHKMAPTLRSRPWMAPASTSMPWAVASS